ncbi:VOC family protein [Paraburkholderia sp. J12]|uniref:VOC family protein n=1 Tax=Paraburkholderia sp. J12 TaxID=2805432 RepID=UPI002ABE7A25|nr:VOC family protein [Paraburkholderia sp. J12]
MENALNRRADAAPLPLAGLAYLGVGAKGLESWRTFASTILGVAPVEFDARTLALRFDACVARLVVEDVLDDDAQGLRYIGWQLAPGVSLDDAAACLHMHGIEVERGREEACARRGVAGFIGFHDPLGNRVECCASQHEALEPPVFTRPLAGFKTDELGLGHVVLLATDPAPALDFYQRVLGFRVSDSAARPFDATFLHINARHHSLAVIRSQRTGLHHLMLELLSLDDVGQAYDLVAHHRVPLGASLGRHSNDYMTSFYVRTPSDFMIELGWGGRLVDMANWEPEELSCGPSLWGHERTWLPEPARSEAERMRLEAAVAGLKAPVQVRAGFFDEIS